jgi:hypothetical protein
VLTGEGLPLAMAAQRSDTAVRRPSLATTGLGEGG